MRGDTQKIWENRTEQNMGKQKIEQSKGDKIWGAEAQAVVFAVVHESIWIDLIEKVRFDRTLKKVESDHAFVLKASMAGQDGHSQRVGKDVSK